jgi:tRNA A-37 threonylcarbamoyl transferase component Bud32
MHQHGIHHQDIKPSNIIHRREQDAHVFHWEIEIDQYSKQLELTKDRRSVRNIPVGLDKKH